MGRNNKNIKIQLNNRIDELLRIGQRKIKCDSTNSNRAEGIHSIRSAETYRSVANNFAEYLKAQNIKNIADITREVVQGYITSRNDLSSYTLSKDLSAINKILDSRYTLREFGIGDRTYSRITNNRGLAKRDTSNALRNQQQLDFVRATGIRRQSIDTISPKQAIRDCSGLVIGFNVCEKGGRERNCVVLQDERKRITEIVDRHIIDCGIHAPLFKQVDSNANPHFYRREYAQGLYSDLQQAKGKEEDYYNGMRDVFINQHQLEKATSRYEQTLIQGFESDILAEVSQNVGHNRIDVVIYHYLK